MRISGGALFLFLGATSLRCLGLLVYLLCDARTCVELTTIEFVTILFPGFLRSMKNECDAWAQTGFSPIYKRFVSWVL
jgi:hypothetical protein